MSKKPLSQANVIGRRLSRFKRTAPFISSRTVTNSRLRNPTTLNRNFSFRKPAMLNRNFSFKNPYLSKIQPQNLTSKAEWEFWLNYVRKFYLENSKSNIPGASEVSPVFVEKPRDNRPYIQVTLYNQQLVALLDSGANQSIIGSEGLYILDRFNIKIQTSKSKFVTTADGQKQQISGSVLLPICLENKCKLLEALIVPSLCHSFILGSDFLKLFGLFLNFKTNTWEMDNQSIQAHINVVNNSDFSNNINKGIQSTSLLSSNEKIQVNNILEKFKELSPEGRLGRTNKFIQHIDTGDARPIRQRQYQLSPYLLKELNNQLDEMLRLGVVEPSFSSWSSPVLLVKKSDNSYRFCFDGRKLNSVTKADSYPLPRVDHILNMLKGAKFISSIDLKSAFWQIPLTEESKEKTAFSVPGRGLFHFCVVPFGLTNSAQAQQRLMDSILGPEIEPFGFVYLDDVILISSSFDDHITLLNEVFSRLKSANLTINYNKCQFFRESLNYLGFVVDKNGLRTNPDKVEAMVNYPRPKNSTEVKRFLGLASWYRRFVPHFSTIVSPLNELLKGGKGKKLPIQWNDVAEKAFQDVKQALVSAPILSSPDFSLKFTIQCDASATGLGSVLTQVQDGVEKVIAFASRSLSRTERNWSTYQRELAAVLFGITKFRPFIEGTRFTVITDHYSLLWFHKLREPTGVLARWAAQLQQFDFDIVHRKGKLNVVPDALSRSPLPEEVNILGVLLEDLEPWYLKMRDNITNHPENYPHWAIKDGYIYKYLPKNIPLKTNMSDWKLVVPLSQRKQIISQCHDIPTSGHFGFYKTIKKITENFYWPKMRKDVFKYIRNCDICHSQKMPNSAPMGFMGTERKISMPFQCIFLDFLGPYPRSPRGNTHAIVVSDYFTKYILVKPIRAATAKALISFIENEVFLIYGVSQFIVCDNGTQMTGKDFKEFTDKYKVQVLYNARYHPQTNAAERNIRTLLTSIRCFLKRHKDWDQEIYKIAHAMRVSTHHAVGYSPVFLNFGRNIPISGDFYEGNRNEFDFNLEPGYADQYAQNLNGFPELYKKVQEKLNVMYRRYSKQYNLRRRDFQFNVGDKVWKRNHVLSDAQKQFSAKLAPRYVLCRVRRVKSRIVYELDNMDGTNAGTWHISQLKPYLGSNSDLSE